MSIYFVDHVTTYRKHCKTGKGKILEGLLPKFKNILMMEGGPVSFCVDVKTKSDPVNGTLFFSSLEEIEECANILLDYVRKHKK